MMDEHDDRLKRLTKEQSQLLAKRLREKAEAENRTVPLRGGEADGLETPPMSFAEERFWLLETLEPGNPAHHIVGRTRLVGPLKTAALKAALSKVAQRFEILRTSYVMEAGEPRPRVAADGGSALAIDDLRGAKDRDRQQIIGEVGTQAFDLSRAPLWRVRLLILDDEVHDLVFAFHHIIADGLALQIFARALQEAYQAAVNSAEETQGIAPGQAIERGPSYRDYAQWQRREFAGSRSLKGLTWWDQRLRHAEVLHLPTDHPRHDGTQSRGARYSLPADAELLTKLRAQAQSQSVTPHVILLTALKLLLSRLGDASDISVGIPVAGRDQPGTESILGFFVNSLVVRSEIDPRGSFAEALSTVRKQVQEARAHESIPFEAIVKHLNPERVANRNPLFQVMFNYVDFGEYSANVGGVEATYFSEPVGTLFDLTLYTHVTQAGLRLEWEYDAALFEESTVARWLRWLRELIALVAETPDVRMASWIPTESQLDQEVQRGATHGGEALGVMLPHGLAKALHKSCAQHANSLAVLQAGTAWSYAELWQRSHHIAAALLKLELDEDARVGIALPRSLDMIATMFACLRLGRTWVPLDLRYPEERWQFMAKDAQLGTLVITQGKWERRNGPKLEIPTLNVEEIDPTDEPEELPRLERVPERIAYLIYTSGSTGQPKGVEVPLSALEAFLEAMLRAPGCDSEAIWLSVTTLSFDIALLEIFLPLLTGARIVLADDDQTRDGGALARLLAKHEVTIMQATPSTWRLLLLAGWTGQTGLRALCGGEALSHDLLIDLQSRTREVWNLYGPTETTIWSARADLSHADAVHIGRPIEGTQLHIVDQELESVALGLWGELLISGAGLAAGYFRAPGLTQQKFIRLPSGDRAYRTGDRARIRSDGTIEYGGRLDRQIKLRGHRLEPAEIETRLREHPEVQDAVVDVIHDDNVDHLAAWVVAGDIALRGDALSQRLGNWFRVWEDAYATDDNSDDEEASELSNRALDTTGWVNPITGQPESPEIMAHWASSTLERLRRPAWHPRGIENSKVFEVGCGTGMLLLGLAPQVAHYVACDPAEVRLEQLKEEVERRGLSERVELNVGHAGFIDSLSGGEAARGSYDLVIVNSVAQYLPDARALVALVDNASKLLRPGGTLWLGDLRSEPLLPFHHAWCVAQELASDAVAPSGGSFARKISDRVINEAELCVDPKFVQACVAAEESPWAFGRAELKAASGIHELSLFRFDATLCKASDANPGLDQPGFDFLDPYPLSPTRINAAEVPDRSKWARLVAEHGAVLICGLSDPRQDWFFLWMGDNAGRTEEQEKRTGSFWSALSKAEHAAANSDTSPHAIYQWAQESGFDARLFWSQEDNVYFDALIAENTPREPASPALVTARAAPHQVSTNPLDYLNRPAGHEAWKQLRTELRLKLAKHFPDVMVPTRWISTGEIPKTPNGKIDRRALLRTAFEDSSEPAEVSAWQPTALFEKQVFDIWTELLRHNPQPTSDFFRAGGHSLLAAQLVARLGELSGITIPLRDFFANPTPMGLAQALRGTNRDAAEPKAEALQLTPRPAGMDTVPMSRAQRRLYFITDQGRNSNAYIMKSAVWVRGKLTEADIRQAFGTLTARHESLRTVFGMQDGVPIQRVLAALPDGFNIGGGNQHKSLDDLTETLEGHLNYGLGSEKHPAWDLYWGSIHEERLHERGLLPSTHCMMFRIHHMLADAVSVQVLWQEFFDLLGHEVLPEDLPLIGLQPADLAWHESEGRFESVQSEALKWWLGHLNGTSLVWELPGDRLREANRSRGDAGGLIRYEVDPALSQSVAELSRSLSTTPFVVQLSAFAVLLHRMGAPEDFLIGTAAARRGGTSTQRTVGFLVSTLPLRMQLHRGESFESLVRQVHDEVMQSLDHGDLAFEELVQELNEGQSIAQSPLFPVTFDLVQLPEERMEVAGGQLVVTPRELPPPSPKFDLSVRIEQRGKSTWFCLEWDAALFDEASMHALDELYADLLDACVENPKVDPFTVQLASMPSDLDDETFPLPSVFGAIPDASSKLSLVHRLAQHARDRSAATAFSCQETVSYGTWWQEVEAATTRLAQAGLRPGSRVALCGPRSSSLAAWIVAIWKCEAIWVALDESLPMLRVEKILERTEPAFLVVDPSCLKGPLAETCHAQGAIAWDAWPKSAQARTSDLKSNAGSQAGAGYIIHTSGSSGEPKGVHVALDSLEHYLQWAEELYLRDTARGSDAGDAKERACLVPWHGSLAADLGLTGWLVPLIAGGAVQILPEDPANPLQALSIGADRPYSFVKLTPSHLRGLQYLISAERRGVWSEQLIVGGEALRYDDVRPWTEHGLRVFNEYGPTEATIGCAVWEVREADIEFLAKTLPAKVRPNEFWEEERFHIAHAVPIGQAAPGMELRVCDQAGGEVPVGAVGELWIAGPQLALGYWKDRSLSAQQFVECASETGEFKRFYRTGDLVRYSGTGALVFLGREDHQVKIRGHRIELGEVEAEILRHESVRHVHVEARVSDESSAVQLHAYILCKPAFELKSEVLQAHLLQSLQSAAIPHRWVQVSGWPLSETGKLDIRAMKALALRESTKDLAGRAPESDSEKLVASVFEEVLGASVRSTSDDFFALGGDSIKALMLVDAFAKHRRNVWVEALFTLRTVGALALALDTNPEHSQYSFASKAPPEGRLPLLPAQRWFFSHRMPQWHHWNQAAAARVSAHIPSSEIADAWQGIVAAHAMLTTRFLKEDGNWWMEARTDLPDAPSVFFAIEGRSGESRAQWSDRKRAAIAKAQSSLNPELGQLSAAVVSRFHGESEWEFKALVHHLAVDGLSWHILLNRLTEWLSKNERTHGEASALHQAAALQALPLLPMAKVAFAGFPTDYPEAANLESSTLCLTQVLEKSLLPALTQNSQFNRWHATIESYLFAVWLRVLQEHAGAEVSVLLESLGRVPVPPVGLLRRPKGGVGWHTRFDRISLPFVESGEVEWQVLIPLAAAELRKLRLDERTRDAAPVLPFELPVAFNFLGTIENVDPQMIGWHVMPLLPTRAGTRGPKNPRTHLVELDIYLFEDRIHLEWSFGDRFDQATVLGWQKRFDELLDESLSAIALDDGRRTPSDFPLVDLTQVAVNSLTMYHQIEVVHPLTPTQLGMVFHERLHPGSGAYFEQRVALFAGDPFQLDAYRAALKKVMSTTPLLRSDVIFLSGQEPLMRVYQSDELAVPFSYEQIEDAELDDAKAYAKLESYAAQDRQEPFQIDEGPLWRAHVIEFDGGRWGLILSHHHVLFDGWSLPNLLLEVARNYELAKAGPLSGGFSFNLPFHEYVGELRKPVTEEGKEFFREELQGFGQATRVGNAQASPDAHSHLELGRVLDERETARLSEAAAQAGITLGVMVQAAWGMALAQAAGVDASLFGLTVSGRSNLGYGAAGCLGMFINTVPVGLHFDDAEITVREWLSDLQARNLQRLKFENTPLTVVQGLSEIPAGQPMFQSVLVFENYPIDVEVDRLREGESNVHLLRSGGFERTHYPATLVVVPGDRITLRLLYDPRVLEGESGPQLLCAFVDAMQSLAQGMERSVLDIHLLSVETRKQLWDWGRGPSLADEAWESESAVARIFRQMQDDPHRRAIEAAGPEHRDLSYGELQRQVLRIAGGLHDAGVSQGQIIPWVWERSPSSLASMLGIAAIGAKFFPLDPQWPEERMLDAILRVGARIVVTSEGVKARAEESLSASVDAVLTAESFIDSADHAWSLEQARSRDHSEGGYCMMTSGSTGDPRIVKVDESSLRWFSAMAQQVYGFSPADRVLQFAQPSFDTYIEETWPVLASGGCVQLRREEDIGSLRGFLNRVVERKTTVLDLPTAYWHLWMESWPAGFAIDQTHLRLVILGGEAVSAKALSEWKLHVGDQCRLLNSYGPTEGTVVCAAADLTNWEPHALVPIGKPLPEVELLVLDHQGRLALPGADGQLAIGGPGVAAGYVGDHASTAQRFVPHPMKADERCHLTGDQVRFAMDGTLIFLGRIDRQFKLRGIRLDPSEVEAALCAVDGISQAYVACVGEGPTARVGAWVLTKGEGFEDAKLKRRLAQRLPEVARPDSVQIVDTWPLTSTGKIDGGVLVERMSSKDLPAMAKTGRNEALVDAPPQVRRLCGLFAQAFAGEGAEGDSALRIHPDDGFFELGGHSLIAVRLAALIEDAFDRTLPLAWMFEGPSPRQLAQWLDGEAEPPVATRSESVFEEAAKLPLAWPLHQMAAEAFSAQPARDVLVTGATGYFGGHILDALLRRSVPKIRVLVRADDPRAAEARIRGVLGEDFKRELGGRVEVIVADLAQAEPGLPSERFDELAVSVDTIIHCAASTDFGRSFDHLAPMNIEGTKQMVLLALQGRAKALHHVSTIGVFDRLPGVDESEDERSAITTIGDIRGGYAQSKACAERVVATARKRGVPTAIYRPGRLVGSPVTPSERPSSTLMGRIAKASRELNAVPDLSFDFDLTPVSWAAEALVALVLEPASLGNAHHLINPVPLSLRKVVEGFPALSGMEVLSPKEFIKRLEQGLTPTDPLRLLLPAFADAMDPSIPAPKVTHELTMARLERLKVPAARESFGEIAQWFSHLIAPDTPSES